MCYGLIYSRPCFLMEQIPHELCTFSCHPQGPLLSELRWPTLQVHSVISAPGEAPAPSPAEEPVSRPNPLTLPASVAERCPHPGDHD